MARGEVPMSLRRTIVEIDPATLNVSEFCRQHGIDASFFWRLRRRYAAEGEDAIVPRSRAPKTIANRTAPEVEDEIVTLRKELTDAGLDAGPATIAFHLQFRLDGEVPSEATIWRVLRRRGFVHPDPSKAPKHAHLRFTAERANECWQLDDTGWALADGTEVKVLNVLDDHSRLLVASVAFPSCTGAAALGAVAAAAVVLGWPERILSDNAKAFRHTLADALAAMGIAARRSRPHHPQTNGKVERFHDTLKKWLRRQPRAHTLEALQAQLDAFRHLYNHGRPHRSLGRRFPAVVWTSAPKSGPADRPLVAATELHQVVVNRGAVKAGHRYTIAVGSLHDGREALVVITGTNCHVFVEGRRVRQLRLDPTRRHQALYPGPGRPRLP